jgi:hypothetical protein
LGRTAAPKGHRSPPSGGAADGSSPRPFVNEEVVNPASSVAELDETRTLNPSVHGTDDARVRRVGHEEDDPVSTDFVLKEPLISSSELLGRLAKSVEAKPSSVIAFVLATERQGKSHHAREVGVRGSSDRERARPWRGPLARLDIQLSLFTNVTLSSTTPGWSGGIARTAVYPRTS